MEKNKRKQEGLKEQVHSEFETSAGNDYNVVREEMPVKKDSETDPGEPLNLPPQDEDSVKNEKEAAEEPPKMNAEEKKKDG